MRRIICWIFGHRWMHLGGEYATCIRCGYTINFWKQ